MSKSQSHRDPVAFYLGKFGKRYPDASLGKLVHDARGVTLWAIMYKRGKEYLFTGGVKIGDQIIMIASAYRQARKDVVPILIAVPVPEEGGDPNWNRKSREVQFYLFRPDGSEKLDERTAKAPFDRFVDVRDIGKPGDHLGFEDSERQLTTNPLLRLMKRILGLEAVEGSQYPKQLNRREFKLWPGHKKTASTTSRTIQTPPATKRSKS